MAPSRRGREPRLFSRCPVEFDRPAGVGHGETEDLSPAGLFIRTEALLPPGEETEVRLTLPDGSTLRLRARVAHLLTPATARAVGRHPGIGLALVEDDAAARRRLRAHLLEVRGEITSPRATTATHVLLVEPSAPLRARVERALAAAGMEVTSVEGATAALAACARWRPDAVLAAAAMEGMSGVDLAHAMSEHAVLTDVPLVLTADDPSDLSRLEAYRAGVRDYVPRPFVEEELVIRVQRAIAPPAALTGGGVRGALADIGLGTVLSLLEFERKSGVLLVVRGGDVARLFVARGRVLDIVASRAPGDARARLLAVLDWTDGQFEFSACPISGPDALGASVTQVLLEHARLRDEAAPR